MPGGTVVLLGMPDSSSRVPVQAPAAPQQNSHIKAPFSLHWEAISLQRNRAGGAAWHITDRSRPRMGQARVSKAMASPAPQGTCPWGKHGEGRPPNRGPPTAVKEANVQQLAVARQHLLLVLSFAVSLVNGTALQRHQQFSVLFEPKKDFFPQVLEQVA